MKLQCDWCGAPGEIIGDAKSFPGTKTAHCTMCQHEWETREPATKWEPRCYMLTDGSAYSVETNKRVREEETIEVVDKRDYDKRNEDFHRIASMYIDIKCAAASGVNKIEADLEKYKLGPQPLREYLQKLAVIARQELRDRRNDAKT